MPFDSAGIPNVPPARRPPPLAWPEWMVVSEALVRGGLAALCLAFGLVMCRLAIGG